MKVIPEKLFDDILSENHKLKERNIKLEEAMKYIADHAWVSGASPVQWINEFCDVAKKSIEISAPTLMSSAVGIPTNDQPVESSDVEKVSNAIGIAMDAVSMGMLSIHETECDFLAKAAICAMKRESIYQDALELAYSLIEKDYQEEDPSTGRYIAKAAEPAWNAICEALYGKPSFFKPRSE